MKSPISLHLKNIEIYYETVKLRHPLVLSKGRRIDSLRERTVKISAGTEALARTGHAAIFDSVRWANFKPGVAVNDELSLKFLTDVSLELAGLLKNRHFSDPFCADFFLEEECNTFADEFERTHTISIQPQLRNLASTPFSIAIWHAVERALGSKSFLWHLVYGELREAFVEVTARYRALVPTMIARNIEADDCTLLLEKQSPNQWILTASVGEDVSEIFSLISQHGAHQVKLKVDPLSFSWLGKFIESANQQKVTLSLYLDGNRGFASWQELQQTLLRPLVNQISGSKITILGLEEPLANPFEETSIKSPWPIYLDESAWNLESVESCSKLGFGLVLKSVRPVSLLLTQLVFAQALGVPLCVQDLTLTKNAALLNRALYNLISGPIGLECNAGLFLSGHTPQLQEIVKRTNFERPVFSID